MNRLRSCRNSLECFGSVLARLRSASGAFCGRLKAFGSVLAFGSVWERLGSFWERWGSFGGRGRVWNVLGVFWECFGSALGAFGCVWESFGSVWKCLGTFGSVLECLE